MQAKAQAFSYTPMRIITSKVNFVCVFFFLGGGGYLPVGDPGILNGGGGAKQWCQGAHMHDKLTWPHTGTLEPFPLSLLK